MPRRGPRARAAAPMTALSDWLWLVAVLVVAPALAEPLPESWRLPRPQDQPPRSYNYPGGAGGAGGGGGLRPGPGFPPGYPGPPYGQGGGGAAWPRPQHPDYHEMDGGVVGAPCDYDEDCPESAYCRGQQSCACKRPYRPSADGTRCLATIGAPCSSRYDCAGLGPGADCDQDVCHCGTGYVPSADGSCIAGAQSLNGTCELDLQCETLGTGVTCVAGKCQCVPGRHAYNDRCIANVALHGACSQTHECFIGEGYQGVVECQSGTCRCKDQYMDIGDGKCSPSGATRLSAVIPSLVLVLLITFSI